MRNDMAEHSITQRTQLFHLHANCFIIVTDAVKQTIVVYLLVFTNRQAHPQMRNYERRLIELQ